MKMNGNYYYRWAIILTPDKVRELDALLHNYYSKVSYKATLSNKSKIEFENVEELLDYDNALKRSIKSITIFGTLDYDCTALAIYIDTCSGFIVNCSYSAHISYTVNKPEDEMVFLRKLKTIFNKMRAPYSLLCKLGTKQILLLIALVGIASTIYTQFITKINLNSSIDLIGSTTIGMLLVLISIFIDKLLLKIYPPIVYMWGEGITKNQRLSTRRRDIILGIFVTALIGLGVNFISKTWN